MLREAITLAVVIGVYALLAWPKAPLRRPTIAILGAGLLVLVGLVGWRAALGAIDLRTLALLAGMMLLVGALDAANAFAVIASRLVRALPTPAALLAGSMLVVAVLSVLVLNDAVVLLFTPVLVRAARSMGVPAFPFLCAEALAANLGSAATPTGNPQNAAIALARSIPYGEFAARLAPVAALCLALGVLYCLIVFRRDLRAPAHLAEVPLARFTTRPAIASAGGCVALALVGFAAGPAYGAPIWAVALASGVLAVVLRPRSVAKVARAFDAGVLVFFVGLFVLLEGMRASGAADLIASGVARAGSGGFVVATALLSNVVSNVPAVLLLLPGVTTHAEALLLAVASTFAGNLTFFGSAATVIVAETARANGEDLNVARFTIVGAPIAAITLLVVWAWLG